LVTSGAPLTSTDLLLSSPGEFLPDIHVGIPQAGKIHSCREKYRPIKPTKIQILFISL